MPNKPHLKLNTEKQADKIEVLKFNYGFPPKPKEEEKKVEKSYFLTAKEFRRYLTNLNIDLAKRIQERSQAIEIPNHIDYIRIIFQSQFDNTTYYQQWFKEFGLLGISFSKFNHEVLFSIDDRDLFQIFINNIEKFIQKELKENEKAEYSGKIKYIKEFKLLSTQDILQYRQHTSLMNLVLVDFPINVKAANQIYSTLEKYLEERNINYRLLKDSNHLEIFNSTETLIDEIAKNFDIVLSITSSLATVVKPSEFNLPERSYGFEIENSEDDLPIIGIIDTGISNQTPLASIIVNDDSFNITGTSVFTDNACNGSGHGTGVAALAALGRNAYYKKYSGKLKTDAKLLSIKILDSNSGFLSEGDVLTLLRNSKAKYPALKIFVLTTCYQANKRNNEDYSTYAYELDKFVFENDCLVIICTANNDDAMVTNSHYDLNYFFSEITNICSPAESMNNLIVGAAADSIRDGIFEGISTSKEFPTLFSRKSHIDLDSLFPKNKINKFYFRPDVIESGGDYERQGNYIGTDKKATMEILSAKQNESFFTDAGTSYSAPLVANIAVQIQKNYPNISAQSIKALIINAASLNLIRFPKQFTKLLSKTAGHGFVEPYKSVYSDENAITFLIEDKINPEDVKIFPLNFPEYLTKLDLGKQNGILKVSATLCFSFLPVLNHQLAYCPIHIAFGIFKNQTGKEILAKEDEEKGGIKSKLKSGMGWSQSARHKEKPIPYSNTQKLTFPINVNDLLNESNTFKLGVNCRICPQLLAGSEVKYQTSHSFSIVISIEENLKEENLTGQLYAEMESVNFVENIAELDSEGEGIAEGEA
jgi:Subtilase family